uniref:Uncharacterized protein n=1 Tax=Polytomella parva TaxID=51329 RepID=A0A7S0VCK0_9CHLO|mmetsp:Transcript_387/g.468  ORF Transcript_387/g.468 Transcript_387/m.468 type:complete len:315 (+) Transcript_387:2-946(+)
MSDKLSLLPWSGNSIKETVLDRKDGNSELEHGFKTINVTGLSADEDIQVRWFIEPDEGQSYFKWWRAKIISFRHECSLSYLIPKEEGDENADNVALVEYEAFDSFDVERSEVAFLPNNRLVTLDEELLSSLKCGSLLKNPLSSLRWRRLGDSSEPAEDDEDVQEDGEIGEDAAEAQEEDTEEEGESCTATETEGEGTADEATRRRRRNNTLSLKDLSSDMVKNEKEWLNGRTLEQAEAEALAPLPAHQRANIAAGFRDFADKFMDFLKQKEAMVKEEGASVVITEEDIRSFQSGLARGGVKGMGRGGRNGSQKG